MLRLHRFRYHASKLVGQRLEVRLVAEPGGESFEGLSRVVLPSVETPVNKGLDAAPQRVEQGRYKEGGDHDGQLRLLRLACKRTQYRLGRRHAPEVERDQHGREGAVDEGTVDDYVYIVDGSARRQSLWRQAPR